MIDDVCDTFGWNRKHVLNDQVSTGNRSDKRGSKPIYGEEEKKVILSIWKMSKQPCGKLLKPTLALWLESYEKHNTKISVDVRKKILKCSPQQLDRITAPHKLNGERIRGRRTGRTSHRLKDINRCSMWPMGSRQTGMDGGRHCPSWWRKQ